MSNIFSKKGANYDARMFILIKKNYCPKVVYSQNVLVMLKHLPRTCPGNFLNIQGKAAKSFVGVGRVVWDCLENLWGRVSHFLPGAGLGRACIPETYPSKNHYISHLGFSVLLLTLEIDWFGNKMQVELIKRKINVTSMIFSLDIQKIPVQCNVVI